MLKKLLVALGKEIYHGNVTAILAVVALLWALWTYIGQDYYVQHKTEVGVTHEMIGDLLTRQYELEAKLAQQKSSQGLKDAEYGKSMEVSY